MSIYIDRKWDDSKTVLMQEKKPSRIYSYLSQELSIVQFCSLSHFTADDDCGCYLVLCYGDVFTPFTQTLNKSHIHRSHWGGGEGEKFKRS